MFFVSIDTIIIPYLYKKCKIDLRLRKSRIRVYEKDYCSYFWCHVRFWCFYYSLCTGIHLRTTTNLTILFLRNIWIVWLLIPKLPAVILFYPRMLHLLLQCIHQNISSGKLQLPNKHLLHTTRNLHLLYFSLLHLSIPRRNMVSFLQQQPSLRI